MTSIYPSFLQIQCTSLVESGRITVMEFRVIVLVDLEGFCLLSYPHAVDCFIMLLVTMYVRDLA